MMVPFSLYVSSCREAEFRKGNAIILQVAGALLEFLFLSLIKSPGLRCFLALAAETRLALSLCLSRELINYSKHSVTRN